MASTRLFSGIPRSDAEKLKKCLGANSRAYIEGEEILRISGERFSTLAYVAQGSVSVYLKNGEEDFLSETISFGDVFGELFYLPPPGCEYIFVAETDCEIIFINYTSAITPCTDNCYYHLTLIDNLFRIGAKKAQNKALHLHIMKSRKIRNKILSYLKSLENKEGSSTFDIPLSQTELAEYLAVDRSAMARELSNMKKEGLLIVKGRHCALLESAADL